MTLGHEYGHVWFHAPLWRKSGSDTDEGPTEPRWTCHRDRIVDAPQTDWMEFQAAYVGGALLMPSYSVKLWAREIAMREAKQPPLPEDSDLGRADDRPAHRAVSGAPSKPLAFVFCGCIS